MKQIIKKDEPEELSIYRNKNPLDDWKNGFKKNAGKEPNDRVREALYDEQYGLCVYCEIDLKNGRGQATNDFRVEHFYPENPREEDKRNDGINYALYWPNLFGCCTGGNAKYVVDKVERYSNPDFHCDVPKGNKDLTREILNPISDIPLSPQIFDFDEEGGISVSNDRYPDDILEKARNTISYLNLDSTKLRRFRKSTINMLREQITFDSNEIMLLSMKELAECHIVPNGKNELTAFYSTIRWYLSPGLEEANN